MIIWADKQYQLDNKDSLSDQELQWLACELGKWLDLPVKQSMQRLSLPTIPFQKELPKILPSQVTVEKPIGSRVILIKRRSGIDILIPLDSSQNTDDYTQLHIDNQQIHLTSASRKSSPPSLRIGISAIEYYSNNDNSQGVLIVWAGQQKYELGEDGSLSSDELKWLAYELSIWLKLPIHQTKM